MMKDLDEEIDKETAHFETGEGMTTKDLEYDGDRELDYLEKVRHRAYLLWQSDGEPDGRDQDYWYRAEREIAEEEGEPGSSAPRLTP